MRPIYSCPALPAARQCGLAPRTPNGHRVARRSASRARIAGREKCTEKKRRTLIFFFVL